MQTVARFITRASARWRVWRRRRAELRQLQLIMMRRSDHLRIDAGLAASMPRDGQADHCPRSRRW